MPPPQHSKTCVENIKKKFENVNLAEAAITPKAILSSKPPPSKGSAGEQCNSPNKSDSPRKKKPSGVISSSMLESSYKTSPPVQVVPLKIERQISSPTSRNVRRSPAFRCDKVVRARNLISQSGCRDSPKSVVVRRVKQFDDQSVDLDNSILPSENQNGMPVSWRSKLKSESNEAKPSESRVSSESALTTPPKSNILEVQKKVYLLASSNISDDKKLEPDVCSAIKSGESDHKSLPFRKSSNPTSPSQEKNSKGYEYRRVQKPPRNVYNNHKKDTQTNSLLESVKVCREKEKKSASESKHDAAVKAALEAPLPCGPPPRKPPRTFAHFSVTNPNGSASAISSLEPPSSVDTISVITKPLRSKTESQILLKKLENVLGGMPTQKSFADSKKLSQTNGNNGEQISLRDFPPDLVSVQPQKHSIKNLKGHLPAFKLGNCFNSFSCAGDSGVYSQIISHDPNSKELNQELMSTAEIHQKLYGTFHKAHSEEHIYAEPFEHMSQVDGAGDERKSSLCSDKGVSCGKRPDVLPTNVVLTNLRSSTQGDGRSGGLHYLCSPIHESVPGLGSDMQTRSLPVPFEAINRELVGVVGPTSLPADTFKMGQAPNHSAMPAAASSRAAGATGTTDTVETDTGPNPTKIKLLMNQAFGSPLQRLPAVGVDSSDSDSMASTPDEGGQTPLPQPQKTSEPPASRPSAPNTNNVREIRRPSVPPPDIPDVSKEALQQLTAERRAYIRRVSSHAKSTKPRRINAASGESRLFDCLLLVGVNLDPDRPKCKVPYIKSSYPPDVTDEEVPPRIALFCFPDASEWPPPAVEVEEGAVPGEEQCYCLVLTSEKGDRKYGYCRRVQPEGANLCLPLAYCLLTSHRASGFYFKVLGELESRHGQPKALQDAFIKELYASGFPSPGQYIRINCGEGSVSPSCGGSAASYIQIKRQYDPRLEERDMSRLFAALTIPVLLQVFGSLLMERKVLFTSSSISKLSACVDSLESTLFPFSWHHTYISVLPTAMLEMCCAPLPYIMGVLKKSQPLPQIEDGIVVDLDTSTIVQSMGDEMTILPVSMFRALKEALQLVRNCTTPHDSARNVLVSEAFVRLFVEVCGHYINHIEVQQDGKKLFAKESFIKAAPSRHAQPFLECFTDTAMFSVFIDSRLDKPGDTKGMFEQRVAEHCEERERNTLLYLKNYKGLNKKKTLGDRFKDWTLF